MSYPPGVNTGHVNRALEGEPDLDDLWRELYLDIRRRVEKQQSKTKFYRYVKVEQIMRRIMDEIRKDYV